MADQEFPKIMPLKIICDDPLVPWKSKVIHAETGEVIPFTYLKFELRAGDMPRIEIHISDTVVMARLTAENITIKASEQPPEKPGQRRNHASD